MGGGEGSAGERMEAPGFFVVRNSLASSAFHIAATPKLTARSQQPPQGRAVCRLYRQASLAALCPALPQQNHNPGVECIVEWSFHAGRLQSASNSLGFPPPDQARILQDHRVRGRHSLQRRVSTSPSLGPHLQGAARSRRPTPPLGRSARFPGPRHRPQSAPLFRGPHLGEQPRPEGAVGSQSFCKWHLELAASQRIFT